MHICHLYQQVSELKEFALPFIRDGVLSRESCLFVADEAAIDDWYVEFQAYGIDVQQARDARALDVVASEAWRDLCKRGSVVMSREVLTLVQTTLSEFKGIRIIGDAGWNNDQILQPDQVCHWEATANIVFEGLEARVVCQYDLNRYEPEYIHSALRTHPVVLYQGRRVTNPFYEGAAILEHEPMLNRSTNDPQVVSEMLARLASIN